MDPSELGRLFGALLDRIGERVDPWWIVLALLAVAILAILGWRRALRRGSTRQIARIRRAGRGEADAETLLLDEGFDILGRQVHTEWRLRVGSDTEAVTCRADLLLERDGLRWIADVKTGDRAPDPRHPATRRQLLEYLLAFEVDGALLVDVERGEIVELGFEALLEGRRR